MMMMGESSSDMRDRIAKDSSFLDKVFSWSIDDIFNDNFYSEEVSKIPSSFDTTQEYLDSYAYPLLEETRVDLRSSLEIISRAPYAKIVSYDKTGDDQSLLYDFEIDEWRNRFNDRGKEPYKTLPGDIFVLVRSQPENIHDLEVLAHKWVLASVTNIFEDDSEEDTDEDSSSSFFTAQASRDIEDVDNKYSSLFLVFLINSTTNKRIWNVLHMNKSRRIIRDVLQRNIADEGCGNSCGSTSNGSLAEDLRVEISSSLNASQYEAILASLQAMKCKHMSRVRLVWGPPGTGKTKTISTLLYLLRRMKVRTLTCAPTNVAITEVAGRLLERTSRDSGETFCFLGDILLFGNKQRLRVNLEVEGIYLDYRVKRLAECFAPLTGWRSCFPSLSNFLEDCVSEYHVYVDNEMMIKKSEQSIDEVDATQIEPFLAFFRNRFKAATEPVRRCISIFVTHVSKYYIGEDTIANMLSLNDVLDSFENLLSQDDLGSEELLKLFSSREVEDSLVYATGYSNVSMLEGMRQKCIFVLRALHHSLDVLPNIKRKKSIVKLCFRMASLIFCTASCSYKLYTTQMKPPSLLVIDEAAQLKECESAIPLQLPGLQHAILFGDECQLPAMVKSNLCKDADFGRSLFQRLSNLGWPKHLLNVQYRMHPAISSFPNSEFYRQQILDAPSVRDKRYERKYLPALMYGPYSFINISEGREELDDDGRSRRNMVEAAVVAKVLHNLRKAWRHSSQRLAVGVISPYAAQVVAIEEMIGGRYENLDNFGVKVKSVDGFQGGEEDIIIISTVRSNTAGAVGFIASPQRTNVALTRARHCLWVFGNERTLVRSDSIWKRLVWNARERCCRFNANEDKSLTDAVIYIKKELNQLDDLLNKDSVLFKSAKWKVLFSDKFVKSFCKLPSYRAKKSTMNLLVKLSNGWRPKNVKADPVCESSVQIVKQYKVEGRYVICTNDISKEECQYTQVLKIWDVVPLDDVSRLVKILDNTYGAFTDDFLSRCKERGLEGKLEVPRTWSNSVDIARLKSKHTESTSAFAGDLDGTNYAENAKVSESLLLMKFYSLSAGLVGHLLSDCDGKALDLPFEVTDEESQIILHQKSSFVLGRSGTGKTTVLTMKLYQKEQLHHMALAGMTEVDRDASIVNASSSDVNADNENILRQLFVTVSPKLCYAIKQHVSDLKSFACNGSSSKTSGSFDVDYVDDRDQFGGIPDSFFGVPPKSYPLVLTFNKFLFMLDGTLGNSYFERFNDELSFSYGGKTSTSATSVMKRKEVNYDKFSTYYWPHFNSQFTKNLDSSRVFTEIISSIKGGLQVGQTDNGKLSLEDYLHLSAGRTSTLSRQEREMIYGIFLTYERMKTKRGEFDLSDFVNDLHRRLKNGRYGGDVIDFVYVDEVQDLTMRQISLFKYICNNVDEGFVFSGDTAQTIARGIDFRFQDVRSLFYKEFLMTEKNDVAYGSQTRGHISPIFHLRQNFRTHAGILKLGHSVIQLIYHFFPHSIDILPPENSLIFGEAPILLESGSDENAIVTIFGNAGNLGGKFVGFGAEQVIVVRDDCVRKEVTRYVGKHALVLTVVECKGLEFQDVLLYNFFGSSPLKNQWRVIYEFMKMQNLLDTNLQPSFPNFNPAKHNVLCSELKQLYVAITRTRQRLWICENKEGLSEPIFDYWKKLCAVQVRQLDDSIVLDMQVASSPEEWKAQGKKLLAVERFEAATTCFERAGDRHWEIYAKAAGLKAAAGRTYDLNPKESSQILKQAAELFESINVYRKAADCFFESKEYGRAGRIYFEQGEESDLKLAGECFALAKHYELAAEVFAKCNLFSECLVSCTKGKLYDSGLQYIQYWKHQKMGDGLDMIEQEFLENCALSLHEQDDKTTMMKYVKGFSSEDSMRAFLKNLGRLDELLDLEVELGNFLMAADIARERGELLREADVLEKGGLFKEACELLLWYMLPGCLWDDGTGWPLKRFPLMEELLLKAKSSAHNIEPHGLYKTVCTDSLLFLNRNYSLFELKRLLIIAQNDGNLRGKILSTKKILDSILKVDFSKYEWERDTIENSATPHLERISRNKVSVETIIYFWNLWKETVLKIFKFLEVIEGNETKDFGKIGDFCLNYLGVRKLAFSTSTVYVCQYPDAEWMKEVDKSFFRKWGKLVRVDIKHLLAAAHNYWSKELISTGMKMLNIFEALRKNAVKNPLSDFGKMRLNLHVYEVAQFLFSYQPIKYEDSKLLQKYIFASVSEYYKCVFPLDWRRSVSQNILLLRETEISRKILQEDIVNNFQGKDTLTYGQLGRVAVVLLGSPKCNYKSSQVVLRGLGDAESAGETFLQVLSLCIKGEAQSQPHLEDSLACKLHRALRDVYAVNWRTRDYIFPTCFLYLVDRLMVSLLEVQGWLLITRSSLVEWFIHLEWKANRGTKVVSVGDKSGFLQNTYCLLVRMLHQLLMNKHETVQWVKKVGINVKENFPFLLLRLVVLMCLLHLNSKSYLKELLDVLSWTEITRQLPHAFTNALQKHHKVGFLNAVTQALNAIEDPLVVVTTGNIHPEFLCRGALYLDIVDQSKEDLLKNLFPNKANTCQDIITDADKSSNTCCTSFPQMKNEGWIDFQDENVWKVFDRLKLIDKNNAKGWQMFESNVPKIKVQIDKIHSLMATAITTASENNACSDEGNIFLTKGDSLLLELWLLSAALDTSGQQLKDSISLIEDSAKQLSSGIPVIEYFLSSLVPQKDRNNTPEIQQDLAAAPEKEKEGRHDGERTKAQGFFGPHLLRKISEYFS